MVLWYSPSLPKKSLQCLVFPGEISPTRPRGGEESKILSIPWFKNLQKIHEHQEFMTFQCPHCLTNAKPVRENSQPIIYFSHPFLSKIFLYFPMKREEPSTYHEFANFIANNVHMSQNIPKKWPIKGKDNITLKLFPWKIREKLNIRKIKSTNHALKLLQMTHIHRLRVSHPVGGVKEGWNNEHHLE